MLIKLLCLHTYVPIFYEYMNVLSLIPYVFVEGRDDYSFTLSDLSFCCRTQASQDFFKTYF